MRLEVEVDAVAGVAVIGAHGGLIAGELEPLRGCLGEAVDAARVVVVDCLAVDAFDGHGLRLLRDAHTRLRARLRVVAAEGGVVDRALTDAGLAEVLALQAAFPAAAARGSGRFARAARSAHAP